MKIYSINDERFNKYGKVINDDFSDILEVLKTRECPENYAMYVASDKDLEACPSFKKLQEDYFTIFIKSFIVNTINFHYCYLL